MGKLGGPVIARPPPLKRQLLTERQDKNGSLHNAKVGGQMGHRSVQTDFRACWGTVPKMRELVGTIIIPCPRINAWPSVGSRATQIPTT